MFGKVDTLETYQGPTMTKDLPVESAIATIVGDPDTIPMSVRLPKKEEKILQK